MGKKKPGMPGLGLQQLFADSQECNSKNTRSSQLGLPKSPGCSSSWMGHEVKYSQMPTQGMSLSVQEPDKWLEMSFQSQEKY